MSKIVETDFNFNDAVQDIMNGKNISGKDGVLAPLVKQLVEAALEVLNRIAEIYNVEFEYKEDDVEKMNKEIRDYTVWKIHYCATFEGHGFSCIPIFQDLVPTMTLEQSNIVTQQWTILRILN